MTTQTKTPAEQLRDAVEAYYPRFRFTPEAAGALLSGLLRGDGSTNVSDVIAALAWYAGQAPDEPKPSWERIAGRMRTVGTLVSDGVATLSRLQREEVDAREKLERARRELEAIPDDLWPEVCERARGCALTPTNAVPPDWIRRPSWVWLLLRSWREIVASKTTDAKATLYDDAN